jgi:ABC-type transport system substrate-binding protein
MSSVVRAVLGAALLVTGASAAMAQSAYQTAPAGSPAAPANTGPVTYQAGASPAVASSGNTASADQPQKPHSTVINRDDVHGGYDPKSQAGARAFWDAQQNLY